MSSVRARLEQREVERRYAARAPQIPRAAEDERRTRLAQNARTIQSDQVNLMLLDMTDPEREVVFAIVNRERPGSLGSAPVIEATLLRVRTVGVEALRQEMQDTTREEQSAVWEILKSATAEEKLGMDGGRACRAALQQVRHDQFMREE